MGSPTRNRCTPHFLFASPCLLHWTTLNTSCLPCFLRHAQLRFHTRIIAIAPDGTLTLERPLPFNVSTAWTPEVHMFSPGIQQSGIEDMRVEFT